MSTEFILVQTSVHTYEDAQRLADTIVEQRLAACCWISGPIQSTYWWQGKMEHDQEWRCEFKTRAELYESLEKAIKVAHDYETPEVVATPLIAGSAEFFAWIVEETRAPGVLHEHGA